MEKPVQTANSPSNQSDFAEKENVLISFIF